MNWYALHVASNTDRQVMEKLAWVGIEGFYPHRNRMSKDRRRLVEEKFFPGYIFGHFDLLEQRRQVISIPQVLQILGWANGPVIIPDAEINSIRILVTSPAPSTPCGLLVGFGDRVRVKHGPLVGLEGYVTRIQKRTRVVVAVTMLPAARAVEVDGAALEVLEKAEQFLLAA
jgi:transcriptional antiterminator NusG